MINNINLVVIVYVSDLYKYLSDIFFTMFMNNNNNNIKNYK